MNEEIILNVYDFDKTIYDGDSSIDFYIFCIRKNPLLFFTLFLNILYFIMYKLNLIEKISFKQKFFSFLKYVRNVDEVVEWFWNKNIKKIKNWYMDNDDTNRVIISASPEFLLTPIMNRIKALNIIASKVDKKSGKFFSPNCYGKEKVIRLNAIYSKYTIENFYSDSYSDVFLAKLAKNSYLVIKNDIKKWNFNYRKEEIKNG